MKIVKHLHARWIYPGDGPPIENGFVAIEGTRIVDPASTLADITLDLGDDAVIIPGLVNSHTHLEFSDLTTPVEPRREFATWIRNVVQQRRSRSSDGLAAVHLGLKESLHAGVTYIAETATDDAGLFNAPALPSPDCLCFREFLGLKAEGVEPQLRTARDFIESALAAGQTNIGLSPHAPYSLHPRLFHGLCDLALEYQLPVMMHLAESAAELQLLADGTGPLVDLFTGMGLWRSDVIPRGTRPLHYLQRLVELPRVVIAHGNLLTQDEQEFVARHPQLSVVYCPRTHAAMQTGAHPWQNMRDLGINLAVGTDSRASNPDLNVWKELVLIQQANPHLPASAILQLATGNAAQALGATGHGTLRPGQVANLIAVLPTDATVFDPERHLFDAPNDVSTVWDLVMLRGEWHDFHFRESHRDQS